MGVYNLWTGIWNEMMEWNSEHTKLQPSHVSGTAQSRLKHLMYL